VLLALNITAAVLTSPISQPIPHDAALEFIYPLTVILLCRLTLNLRSLNLTDEHAHTPNPGQQVSTVRFADAALGNIGVSLSFTPDIQREDEEIPHFNPVDVTLDEVVSNPLAVGIQEDIHRHMNPDLAHASSDEHDGDA